jgi:hypothetical protein
MRRSSPLVIGLFGLVLLTGCASGAGGASSAPTSEPTSGATSEPTASASSEDAAAEQQAQAWLDAAALPPGAVPADDSPVAFNSYQGWPCGPVAQLEGYWTVPDTTVAGVTNWLRENPPADLVSTAGGPPLPEDPNIDGAMVGYIPADESQQGIVYTVAKMDGGVAIRAEIAALTESAVCPSLPPGEMLGKPGQG